MIPVFDLARQHQHLAAALQMAYETVLDRGVFVLGEQVSHFEKAFAQYLGVTYAVGVASGTDALSLSLLALGIVPGDEVILPANSYPSVFGVTAVGAVPRLVDIDPATFQMNPELLTATITKKTKAIIPVHLYGQPADIEKIMAIARREKVPVIEDCAQAAGAEYRFKVLGASNKKVSRNKISRTYNLEPRTYKVGSIADMGCFSFYPTKNIGCLGDGGMVTTNNPDIYKRVKMLRMYGEEQRYVSTMIGRNSRLDELQAAFLLAKLPYLDEWNKRRREIAQRYELGIMNNELGGKTASSVYHLYVIRSKKRDQLKAYLEEKGIGTGIHYPTPIHLVPSLKYLGYKQGDFPESERACAEVLSLPIYPELTDKEIEQVIAAVQSFKG